jgi:hypothetical protein
MLFISRAQLDLARRDRSYPRDEIFRRLQGGGRRHRKLPDMWLRRRPNGQNLFVWQTVISELGALSAVTDDEEHRDQALRFIATLGGDGWRDASLDGHIHVPWVLTTLAAFFDLHRDGMHDRDVELVHSVMSDMAQALWKELRTEEWGDPEMIAWNHCIIGYSAIGVAGLVVDHHDAPAWLDAGMEQARRFLDVGVTPAGMTREGLSYNGYDFKQLGLLLEGLRNSGRADAVIPAGSEAEARLHRVPEWYAHEMFPRGSWLQNYNDANWDPHRPMWGFLLSFARCEPALCATVWDSLLGRPGRGTFGWGGIRVSSVAEAMLYFPDAPIDRTVLDRIDRTFSCPDIGYVSARDSWREDASVFTFNAGPGRAGMHDHADNNSFTLILRGEPIAIDSGAANIRGMEVPSSAHGHNLVFVDKRAEHPASRGRALDGEIVGVDIRDTHVAVVGDAAASYAKNDYNVMHHVLRHAVFVRGPVPYLVTYDDIRKDDEEHKYEYRVHVPRTRISGDDAVRGGIEIPDDQDGVAAVLSVVHPRGLKAVTRPYESTSHPYALHATWRIACRAVNPHFVALFAPADVRPKAKVKVHARTHEVTLDVTMREYKDRITFSSLVDGETRPRALPQLERRR